MIKVFIGADHRGFHIKQRLLIDALELFPEYDFRDLGATKLDPNDDFNLPANRVSQAVLSDLTSLGILICGSAHGVAIQANRYPGIRAICGYTPALSRAGRDHNVANILCLSNDFTTYDHILQSIKAFLTTSPTTHSRHLRRVEALDLNLDLDLEQSAPPLSLTGFNAERIYS